MSRFMTNIVIVITFVLALAIVGGLLWANIIYVRSQPMEKNFLVPWLAARTFMQYGSNPYELSTAQRAQIVYYGKLAEQDQDPLFLWLPMPVELFYFPLALITNYVWAQATWLSLLQIALGTLAILSLRLVGWRPGRILWAVAILSSILWIYGFFSLMNSSGAGFTALAFTGFLLALKTEHEEAAGALLLLSLGVPSLTGLLAFFVLWWVISQRHWRVLWGFLMALALLLGLSFLFQPGWVLSYLHGLVVHIRFVSETSSVGIFSSWSPILGARLGWVLAGLLLLLLFVEWGAALRHEFRHLLWTITLSVTAMPLMGVPTVPTNYVLFFIPVIVLLSIVAESRSNKRKGKQAEAILTVFTLVLWIIAIALLKAGAYKALNQLLFLLLPVTFIPALYWIRWRFTRSPLPQWDKYQ
jgi:hypothetical protein